MSEVLPFIVAIYGLGCFVSFLFNCSEHCLDGYRLAGRIIFWPLFLLKAMFVTAKTSALDLIGKLA
jgi:hypothetical protein